MDPIYRKKKIMQTSVVGIAANVFLSAFKAAVGIFSGSVAIILDAVNNLTDALSSVITIIGVKLASKKPDNKHPFGHGRIEYFTTIIISLIVLGAGLSSMIESVKKIIHPELPNFNYTAIIIIVAAVIVKILLGAYVKRQGKKLNSDALIASGTDASFDAILSASTLISVIAAMFFNLSIDGILGAVISIFIIKAGYELLTEGIGNVLGGRADSETTKAIKQTINEMPNVLGSYDLILHNYGPDYAIGSVHIEIDDTISAAEIHKMTRNIQNTILDKFKIFLTVGVYAVDSAHKEDRDKINKTALTHEGVLGTHGIYFDEEEKLLTLDVVIDFSIKDKAEFCKTLQSEIKEICPDYNVVVNFDANYTD